MSEAKEWAGAEFRADMAGVGSQPADRIADACAVERGAGRRWSGKKKVGDLLQASEFPHLHTDHSLDVALDRFGSSHLDLLPVVSRADLHEMLGVIRLQDVLQAYGVQSKSGDKSCGVCYFRVEQPWLSLLQL